MATNAEEIIVRFRTEGGHEVEEAFRKTADAGDRFHKKITKASGALGDLRAKSEQRIASNIGQITREMASGAGAADVFADSVVKLGESFKGSLLFAAAAAAGLGLYDTIVKTGEAVIQLDSEVAKLTRPKGSSDFLSTDEVRQNLSDISSEIDKIYSQQVTRSHSFLAGLLGNSPNAFPGSPGAIIPGLNAADQERIDRLRKSAVISVDQLTDKQSKLNQVQREAVQGRELQSKVDQLEISHKERLGELAKLAAPLGTDTQSLGAVFRLLQKENEGYDTLKASLQNQITLQQAEFGIQNRIADVQKEMLAPADESLAILDERISGLREELSIEGLLLGTDRQQAEIELKQLEASKHRAQFGRQLQADLAGLELNRVRGGIGSDRARIEAAQTRAQSAAAFGANTPEFQAAEAGLEEEQFNQFQQYEKNPAAFRQKRIDEEFQRKRFDYLRSNGQLPSDIATKPIEGRDVGVVKGLQDLIETLKRLPAAVGVG